MLVTLIIACVVFVILLKIIKTTIKNALIAAAILFLLHTGFGITPQSIWQQVTHPTQTSPQTSVSK
jgi:predicted MFS family arabinose efflux permease